MEESRVLFPKLTDMLKRVLGNRLDQQASSFIDLFTPDGVMEFPFALETRPKRVEGRAALANYLRALDARWEIDECSEPVVHWTINPNVVILEFSIVAHMRETGEPHNQTYIDVISIEGTKICCFRDYWNPTLTTEFDNLSS